MIRLAECKGKWLLMKVPTGHGGYEYWYFLSDLRYGCLNNQDNGYNGER